MKKIDFIHIGFHKTASTYLQLRYFKSNNLKRLNDNFKEKDLDKWFFENFINVNPYEFNKNEFLQKFENELHDVGFDYEGINIISDENLSGNIYLGIDSRELMHRIHDTFGEVKILIIVRNQVDFILSAYSNYVLHGGIKTLKQWICSIETFNGLILEKIKYSFMIKGYQDLFGVNNVEVIPYELLWDNNQGMNKYIEKTINTKVNFISHESSNVMKGRSLLSNEILSFLNRFRINGYIIHKCIKVISLLDKSKKTNDRKKAIKILNKYLDDFSKDNEKTFKLIDKPIHEDYILNA